MTAYTRVGQIILDFLLLSEIAPACAIQSNLNGSNTYGTMKISSRQG